MTDRAGGSGRVVLVTGGGGGIGAAVAMELGRRGDHVVTVDPLVTVDGTAPDGDQGPTTAERIVAAGGSAVASDASVTDPEALRRVVDDLLATHGRLDGVVNVAGITRPTGFARGSDEDWDAVLAVHLDGYVNVLSATLPVMAAAGRGSIVGVTSGSGWRAADAGAYSCAKRAVAALTWQLGRFAPDGVAIDAISPIAMTRMVAAALGRRSAPDPGRTPATGGLSLSGMPDPDDLAPLVAHLLGGSRRATGQVLFTAGTEVAVVRPPTWIELVNTRGAESLRTLFQTVGPVFAAAEAAQATTGGANPRLPARPGSGDSTDHDPRARIVVVGDGPIVRELVAALDSPEAPAPVVLDPRTVATGTDAALSALRAAGDGLAGLDAVVVATRRSAPAPPGSRDWQDVLEDHRGLTGELARSAEWNRAVAALATEQDHAVRLVHVVDATRPGGRSQAQSLTQLARSSQRATGDLVAAVAVALEDAGEASTAAALAAHLVSAPAGELAGAELAVTAGRAGLRAHPSPAATFVLGDPGIPGWFDDALGEVVA